MKMTLEWRDKQADNPQWRQQEVKVVVTRKQNYLVKHDGKPYIFKEARHGEKVLTPDAEKKWVECGRIDHGTIFIGQPDELSYDEFLRTPEGKLQAERMMEQVRAIRANLNGFGGPSK